MFASRNALPDKTQSRAGKLTALRLTGLAILIRNVTKTLNFYKATKFESARSGQVRVETLVILRTNLGNCF
jgi:hypothetical protein